MTTEKKVQLFSIVEIVLDKRKMYLIPHTLYNMYYIVVYHLYLKYTKLILKIFTSNISMAMDPPRGPRRKLEPKYEPKERESFSIQIIKGKKK